MHYLNEYSTFKSTKELNTAVYEHIRTNTNELNETARETLKTISRYAVKYAGAAHLKVSTLAELIGKSEKTVRRTLAKLCELGIIEKIATTRKINGGYGANIIVILPVSDSSEGTRYATRDQDRYSSNDCSVTYSDQSTMTSRESSEKPTNSNDEVTKFISEPSDFNKRNKSTKELDTATPVPASALRSALPHAVYNAMAPFCNADEIYRYYGLLLQAKRRICPDTLIEHDPQPYVEAFNAVMFKVKHRKVRNIERYMYVAFERAASEVSRRLSREEDSVLHYDWISA